MDDLTENDKAILVELLRESAGLLAIRILRSDILCVNQIDVGYVFIV